MQDSDTANAQEDPDQNEATQTESGALGFDPASLGGSNTLAGLLMAGGVLIITFILMSRLRRKQRSQGSDLSTREQVEQIRSRAAESRSIDAFKADAHDFTRQMAALLDSKAERLEQLIADAEDRLARLDAANQSPSVSTTASRAPREAEPASPTPEHQAPGPTASATRRHTLPDLERPVAVDPLHDRVYQLADSGLDPIAIAREVGQPTGQIELILALRT